MLKENLISDKQFGFMPEKNTSSCLFNVIGKVSMNCQQNLYTALIMLDISKAFDSCDHDIIIEKLFSYGIRGRQLDLYSSFLKDRKQQVAVNGLYSDLVMSVNTGVPQGSMLGVLFFLIYINDMPNASKFDLYFYADDSNALIANTDPQELETQCNIELSKLVDWFSCNKLLLNLKKSQLIVFSPNLSNSPRLDIHFQSNHECIKIKQIPNEENVSARSLGIYLDERLTLKQYVTEITKKVNQSLFFISRVKYFLNMDAKKLLYFSLVHSKLTYCLPLLSLLRKTDMDSLLRLQRKAIKILYGVSQRSSSTKLFHDLGTFPLDILLEKEIIQTMQNIYSYRKPKDLVGYFDVRCDHENIYFLRATIRFEIPLIRSIRLSSSPIYYFATVYNRFPGEFKDNLDRHTFLDKLWEYYCTKYPSEDCDKTFCKFCDAKAYKERIRSFY